MRPADLTPVARDVMKLPASAGLMFVSLVVAYLLAGAARGPGGWLLARPDFVLLVLHLLDACTSRASIGQGMAFALGLLMDVSDSMLLGQHALAYVIAVFGAQVLRVRILSFRLPEQTLHVLGLTVAACVRDAAAEPAAGRRLPRLRVSSSRPCSPRSLWAPVTGCSTCPPVRRRRDGRRRDAHDRSATRCATSSASSRVFRNRLLLAGLAHPRRLRRAARRASPGCRWCSASTTTRSPRPNRISVVPVVPNRGLILDRNGEVLAANYSAYTLEITPSKVAERRARDRRARRR